MNHLRAVDGLRGVAVALVVVSHLAPQALPGGFLGVDVFFVLSGFLITSILVEEAGRRRRVDLARFYIRRCARLLPALLLVLGALGVYSVTLAAPEELSRIREHSFWTLGYLANWRYVADGTTYTDLVAGQSPLRHTWSLAIEEQFYVVFPLLVVVVGLVVAWNARLLRGALIGIGTVGAIASAAWTAWRFDPADPARGYFGTDTRVQALLVGVVLGAVLVGRPPTVGRAAVASRAAATAGMATIAVAVALGDETAAWLQRGGFLLVALATAGVLAGVGSHQTMQRVLSTPPLVRLGLISYGVYLWHWPIIVLADADRVGVDGWLLAMLQVAATLVVSTLSYVLVERPVRAGALRRRVGRPAIAFAPLSIGLVAALLVVATAPPAAPAPALAAPAVATTSPRASPVITAPARVDAGGGGGAKDASKLRPPRDGPPPTARPTATTSTTAAPPPAEPQRVVMLGDSVAHTLAGGVVDEFPRFEPWVPAQSSFDPALVDLRSAAQPGCSFLAGDVIAPDGVAVDLSGFCGDWDGALADGLTAPSGAPVVVVALANDAADRLVDGRTVDLDSSGYQAVLAGWLDQIVLTTSTAGGHVVLVALPPRVGRFATAADVNGRRERLMRDHLRTYADGHAETVEVFDLFETICPAGDCARPPDGFDPSWRYDGMHFTPDGARWVATVMQRQLLDR